MRTNYVLHMFGKHHLPFHFTGGNSPVTVNPYHPLHSGARWALWGFGARGWGLNSFFQHCLPREVGSGFALPFSSNTAG